LIKLKKSIKFIGLKVEILKKIRIIVLIILSITNGTLFSQVNFVENKGQMPSQVEFKADFMFAQIYFERDRFTYNLINNTEIPVSKVHHGNDNYNGTVHCHAYQMKFINSNKNTEIFKNGQTHSYENYYLGTKENWASRVYSYSEIEYKNIYEKINIKIKTNNAGIKYDYEVLPSGNIQNIQVKFDGIEKLYIENEKLILKTSIYDIIELKPYSYQIINGKKTEVKVLYTLKDGIIGFKAENYNKNETLIIDPVLIFSTYSGSTTDNWGFTATYDSKGNVYSGGIIWLNGYPASIGAYQTANAGNWDIAIIKYNDIGTIRQWATYLGGVNGDLPHSLVVNSFDELLILGTTGSSNFPITTNAFDNSFGGGIATIYDNVVQFPNGTDIYISKISEDGAQLLASTFVGGSKNDGLNYKPYMNYNGNVLMYGNDSLYANYADGARGEIVVDDKNDIYVASTTFSNDFPTASPFQSTNNGAQDGVVFKIRSDLSALWWSSYIGGTKDDAAYSIDFDNYYNVFVAGGTVSDNFPTTTGAYNTSFNGGTTDGFVTKISSNGQNIINSTYFGSNLYDQAFFVRLDKQKNVYITGQTKAPGSTLIYNATYNTPNSGQFITKFNPTLSSLVYSTVFGTGSGVPNISLTAFAVDVCNRIYLSGWGRDWTVDGSAHGTTGMEVTYDAVQPTTDGQDFYIMVLKDDASALDYATFFGELHTGTYYCGHDHVDGGTSRFDKKGNIYQSVCASCGWYNSNTNPLVTCNDFPTTTGVWSEDNGGIVNSDWTCNNAVFRFSFIEDIAAADFHFPGNGCEPFDVQFVNTSMGNNYFWDFGDGTTSTQENPSHTFSAGTWEIILVSIDSSTCNISDTVRKTIYIGQTITDTLDIKHICIGGSTQIGINENLSGVTYSWTPNSNLNNPTISNPIASPTGTTLYHLSSNYDSCREIDQLVIVHNAVVDVTAFSDTGICIGETVTLNAIASDSMANYYWYNALETGNILSQNDSITVTPNQSANYIVHVVEPYCNVSSYDTVTVELIPLPISLINDTIICLGDTINLHVSNIYTSDTVTYLWQPTSQIISGENTQTPLVAPTVNTTYYISAINQRGCETLDSVKIFIDNLQATIQKQDVLCFGDHTGVLTAIANGYNPYSYQWSSGGLDSTENFLHSGSYSVTITDIVGCEIILTEVINQPPQLIANVTNIQNTLCGTQTEVGSISTSVSGGTPNYTYHWNNGQTTASAINLGFGDYFVTITDNNGCDTVLSAHIDDPSDLEIALTQNDASCFGYCDGNAIVNITFPSTPPYIYDWSNSENTPSIDSLCVGTYSVNVYDADTCKRVAYVYVNSPDSINLMINTNGIVCHNDSATAIANVVSGGTPNYNYIWSNGQVGTTASGLTEGTYYVYVTDAHNCKDTNAISFINPPVFTNDTSVKSVTCDAACNGIGTIISQGGVSPYTYIWENGSTDSTITNLCPGTHYVTVTDKNGCTDTLEIIIGISEYGLNVEAWADDYLIYNNESTNLHTNSGNYFQYYWSPSSTLNNNTIQNPVASPTTTTMYYVTVTDEFGCKNIDTVLIKVQEIICGEPFIYVPNAFTPNNDGKNDILYAYGDIIDELYFAVYDRWGELMFETNDIAKGWDGTYKGKKLDPAVFVYYIKAICRDEETFIKRGNVTLLR